MHGFSPCRSKCKKFCAMCPNWKSTRSAGRDRRRFLSDIFCWEDGMCKPGSNMSLLWVTETVVFCWRFWRKWWGVWVCKDCILLCQVIKEVPKIHMEYRERTAQVVSGVGWLFITWACFSTWTFVVRCWGFAKTGRAFWWPRHSWLPITWCPRHRIVEVPQVHLQDWIFRGGFFAAMSCSFYARPTFKMDVWGTTHES